MLVTNQCYIREKNTKKPGLKFHVQHKQAFHACRVKLNPSII